MPAPSSPTAVTAAYNDGAIPFGSRVELFCYGGTANPSYRGWYVLESIKPNRPSVTVQRPNQIGGPNGFAIVASQETLSAKAQLATQSTATVKIGDWFQDSLDPSSGTVVIGAPATSGTNETWVVDSASESFEMNGYWYQDLTLLRAHTPTS